MIVIDPILAVKLGLTAKKHWKAVLAVVLLVAFMPVLIVFTIFPLAKPEYVEDYKSIADIFSIGWVETLIIDTVRRDNNFEDIEYTDILNSNVDFLQLNVKEYEYKKIKQKDGSYDWEWVYKRTVTYTGSKQINKFLSDYDLKTAKDCMNAIEDLDNTEKYDIEIIYRDFVDMLAPFNDEQKEWAYGLLASNSIQQMYGEYVELPEFIEVTTDGFFAWPAPTLKVITSPYGNRADPKTGKPVFHRGIDISGQNAHGQPVIASADGTVEQVSLNANSSYGYFVKIIHKDKDGNTWHTRCAHMSQINVKQGDKLKQGDVLGAVGNTGYSTGAHLHFEIYFETQLINPIDFFR